MPKTCLKAIRFCFFVFILKRPIRSVSPFSFWEHPIFRFRSCRSVVVCCDSLLRGGKSKHFFTNRNLGRGQRRWRFRLARAISFLAFQTKAKETKRMSNAARRLFKVDSGTAFFPSADCVTDDNKKKKKNRKNCISVPIVVSLYCKA